jgi:hypothetical protein
LWAVLSSQIWFSKSNSSPSPFQLVSVFQFARWICGNNLCASQLSEYAGLHINNVCWFAIALSARRHHSN